MKLTCKNHGKYLTLFPIYKNRLESSFHKNSSHKSQEKYQISYVFNIMSHVRSLELLEGIIFFIKDFQTNYVESILNKKLCNRFLSLINQESCHHWPNLMIIMIKSFRDFNFLSTDGKLSIVILSLIVLLFKNKTHQLKLNLLKHFNMVSLQLLAGESGLIVQLCLLLVNKESNKLLHFLY